MLIIDECTADDMQVSWNCVTKNYCYYF